MAHDAMELPYDQNALVPVISEETFEYHFGKHYHGYLEKMNALKKGTELEDKPLIDIIFEADRDPGLKSLFNNAAQVFNHEFYFEALAPRGKTGPGAELLRAIESSFKNFEAFKQKFAEAAITHFGSGWAWLVQDAHGKLSISTTENARDPLLDNRVPLLTCDVWEHAYYIDYRHERPKYVQAYFDIINWDVVEKRRQKAMADQVQARRAS